MIQAFLLSGVKKGDLRCDIAIAPAAFSCWGMLSGLIQFAQCKEDYIKSAMGLSKKQFLQYGFDMIYLTVCNRAG